MNSNTRMFRYLILTILFLLPAFSPHSQQNNGQPDYLSLYHEAEKWYQSANPTKETDSLALIRYEQAVSLLLKEKKFDQTAVDASIKAGILQMSQPNPSTAISFFHLAIFFISKNNSLSDSLLFQPYLYTGSIQYTLNNLDSAIFYYKKAEAIIGSYPGTKESERLYNKLGALYFETGDYNKSISYFHKALTLVEERKPLNVFFVVNYKNNIATALMKLGFYDQALVIFNELLKYPNPSDVLLFNTGNTYFEKANYPEALKYLHQIRDLNFDKYSSLIKIFIRIKEYDSAGYYLTKANRVYSENKRLATTLTLGILQKYSGDIKAATGNFTSALSFYQLAILNLDPSFKNPATRANPESFSGLQNFSYLYDALVAKAIAWRGQYKKTGDSSFLQLSLSSYSSAILLASHIEKLYFSDDARLFLQTKLNSVTKDAVDLAVQLYNKTGDKKYLNTAFGFSENNKSAVLRAGLKNLELTAVPGLPAEWINREKAERVSLARLYVENAQTADSMAKLSVQKKIRDLEISIGTIQDKLDENRVYHKLRYFNSFPDMDSLSENIRHQDEAILSYYYTSTQLLCFYITKDHTGLVSTAFLPNWILKIDSLRNELQNPEASGSKNLKDAGRDLFKQLIEPVYNEIKDKKRLVIIPYNEMSYLPFELLVNPSGDDLLLSHFAISYNYSASFISEKKQDSQIVYQVLAMAPFTDKTNSVLGLPPLPYSMDEIKDLPGKIVYGKEATKLLFTRLAGDFSVIHLATHAVANDSNFLGSYIEFYGRDNEADSMHRLYEQEIYVTDLKSARLVILSACETGNGFLINGEGVMSMSRAFSYAGCKTVITSLWRADEISTSFITRKLHTYLAKGMAVDESLQQAKLDYLASNDIPVRFKNPAYWAHLILVGDYRPIVESGTHWLWLLLLIIPLLAFVLWRKK